MQQGFNEREKINFALCDRYVPRYCTGLNNYQRDDKLSYLGELVIFSTATVESNFLHKQENMSNLGCQVVEKKKILRTGISVLPPPKLYEFFKLKN